MLLCIPLATPKVVMKVDTSDLDIVIFYLLQKYCIFPCFFFFSIDSHDVPHFLLNIEKGIVEVRVPAGKLNLRIESVKL